MVNVPSNTSAEMIDDSALGAIAEAEAADGPELCGAELSRGGTCEREATECPWHDD